MKGLVTIQRLKLLVENLFVFVLWLILIFSCMVNEETVKVLFLYYLIYPLFTVSKLQLSKMYFSEKKKKKKKNLC